MQTSVRFFFRKKFKKEWSHTVQACRHPHKALLKSKSSKPSKGQLAVGQGKLQVLQTQYEDPVKHHLLREKD